MIIDPRRVVGKDGTPFSIKSLLLDDAAAFVEHRKLTCGETYYLSQFADEVDLTEEREREILTGLISSPNSALIGAFSDGGELLGTAGLSPVNPRRKYQHRLGCMVAVSKSAWGKGVGRALMEAVIEAARSTHADTLELDVYTENERAIALYRSLGFNPLFIRKNAFKHDNGTYHDELSMQLALK